MESPNGTETIISECETPIILIRQTGSSPLHVFTLGGGGRTPNGARRPSGVSAVVLRIVSMADKKRHLIEVAPFGRLNQMLRATERRRKEKAFDQGGRIWPPRSIGKDDFSGGGVGV